MKRQKWTDENVINWAVYFISNPNHTLFSMENSLGVSHSTTWWCFRRRLAQLDGDLYLRAMSQLATHRGSRYE